MYSTHLNLWFFSRFTGPDEVLVGPPAPGTVLALCRCSTLMGFTNEWEAGPGQGRTWPCVQPAWSTRGACCCRLVPESQRASSCPAPSTPGPSSASLALPNTSHSTSLGLFAFRADGAGAPSSPPGLCLTQAVPSLPWHLLHYLHPEEEARALTLHQAPPAPPAGLEVVTQEPGSDN